MSDTLYDIPVTTIDGRQTTLADQRGRVLLIVNTASKCGLTPQYDGLEALHRRYVDSGLSVLGFPANDFADQEPGSDAEIAAFCRTNHGVDFPIFSKIAVSGPDKHPLYALLTGQAPPANRDTMRERLAGHGIAVNPPPEVTWNFEKFVVGRDGAVVARFSPDTAPDDEALLTAVERELFASE